MEHSLAGGLIVLCGFFSAFCAIRNYDWFIYHRKAALFLKLFGRTGCRIVYVALGVALICVGAVVLIGENLG